MAIKYRNVDADDVESQVLEARALDGERQAFIAEMEVARLAAVAKTVKDPQEREAIVAAQRDAKANAASLRSKANRVKGEGTLDPEAVTEARARFLNDWVTSLEQEHVAHTAVIAQRESALALTGADAPGEEEKKGIETRLRDSQRALEVIESSWKVATAKLDELQPPADK